MGVKRQFEFEDFQERHKHPKPVESGLKETAQFHYISSEPRFSDRDKCLFTKYLPDEEVENDFFFDIPYFDTEDFNSGASSSVTHGSSEEDGEPEMAAHFEDVSSSLDGSPERIVQIGPDHQASIPSWIGQTSKSELDYDNIYEKYLGTCIIPMPDTNTSEHDRPIVGRDRTDCSCIDKGSMRCVRQHVTESQEDLRSNLDDEKFVLLGLADSGEVVACEWSEEEEQLFNEVIYSNPVPAGKNLWRCLSGTFPSRTKGELVSYYFNVFMLQKRAAQNRCRFLDIDSDDDEWHGNLRGVPKEVQEFPLMSLGFKDQRAEQGKIYVEQHDDDDEDADLDNDEDGVVDSDEDVTRSNTQEACTVKSCVKSTFGNTEQITDAFGGFFGLEDDSCTSFDYLLTSPTYTHGLIKCEPASDAKSKSGKSSEETNGLRGLNDARGIGFWESKEPKKYSDTD